jgi:FAD-dependent oxidoreductase domain-containing protein 1
VKTANGEIRSVKFGIVIIAAGPFSAKVARMARIGTGDGMLSIPLPVEPRYRKAVLVFTLIIYY